MHVPTKIVGQQGRSVQVDLGGDIQRAQQIRLDASLEAAHRFAQHLVVELKAHFEHVAALVFAQHFTSSADLQVVHGQIKPAAKLFHLLNRIEPLAGLFGQALQIGHHQVGVGLVVAAADPATQLVQLREAKFVGPAHDDGVGSGHVNAGFDDGGAQQQVVALGDKIAHHALELAFWHLAVRHGDAGLGQQHFELGAPVLDGFDLVV